MFTYTEPLIFISWLLVMLVGVIMLRNARLQGNPARKYFVAAFLLRAFGGLAFGLIYALYYGYGDTFGFYNISKVLRQALEDDPGRLPTILTSFDIGYYNNLAAQYGYRGWYAMMPHTVAVAKAATFFGFLTGGLYLPTALFFSLFSFLGSWAMFRTFQRIYPALYRELAIAILFFPSIWFWGSGLSKDSLTFGAFGFLIYATHHLFFLRRRLILNALLAIVAAYVLFYIKPYVIVAFLPAALSWAIIGYHRKIKSPTIRKFFFPFALIVLIAGFGLINQFLSTTLEQFSLDNVQENVLAYRAGLERYGTAGSQYSLYAFGSGNIHFFSMTMPAFVTTFFRPFPWEVNNVFSVFAAAESFLMLLLFWRLLRRLGFRKMVGSLYQEPVVLFCFIISLIFGIAVGIASQNFGTLVRYRIPALPMFMISLFVAYYVNTGKSLWFKKRRSASPGIQRGSLYRQISSY